MAALLARVVRMAAITFCTSSRTERVGHGTVPKRLRFYGVVPGSKNHFMKPCEDVDEDSSYRHEFSKHPSTSPSPSNISCPAGAHGPIGANGLPVYVDWRVAGAVTPVQSQGYCDSCWAMAAAAGVEGINFIRTGELLKVSEQQLIDCNNIYNFGCKIGSVREAFRYIIRTGGIVEAKYYPYAARQNVCKRMLAPSVTIDSYDVKLNGNEFHLLRSIAAQPTCVMVKVDDEFTSYLGRGNLDGPSYPLQDLNHFITMVAYYPDCFIGKNSWGTDYGDEGYVRIARGVQRPGGPFGITRLIIRPLKWSANKFCQVRSDADMEKKTK